MPRPGAGQELDDRIASIALANQRSAEGALMLFKLQNAGHSWAIIRQLMTQQQTPKRNEHLGSQSVNAPVPRFVWASVI
jgi:hypothetical protein